MSDLEAKSLSTPEKIFRQKILENFLGKNFSRKFVKFLSGWKNFQKSCQEKLSDVGKNCRIQKKLLSGEKFDIPGKIARFQKISVRTEKFAGWRKIWHSGKKLPDSENFGPDRKIWHSGKKLPDSGKSGNFRKKWKSCTSGQIFGLRPKFPEFPDIWSGNRPEPRFRPETSQELLFSTGSYLGETGQELPVSAGNPEFPVSGQKLARNCQFRGRKPLRKGSETPPEGSETLNFSLETLFSGRKRPRKHEKNALFSEIR